MIHQVSTNNLPHSSASQYHKALGKLYPEYDAGGFSRDDEHIIFYSRVNALIEQDMTLLDFGAGRGRAMLESGADSFKSRLRMFRGRCRKVIGVDVDPIVEHNPMLDEAHVIRIGEPLPLADNSVDVILSWAVWEHVEDPDWCARELDRVLRPGGWICAWTPNKYGYIALGAQLLPKRYHNNILQFLFRKPVGIDKFPTHYRMNTLSSIRRHFPGSKFDDKSYAYSGEPRYHAGIYPLALLIGAYNAIVPGIAKAYLHIFLRKKA